jgi:YidC/Oxa1 family membrane protein insertase
VWILAGLHFVLRDWGLAIIALVCFVRLLLHPITKRSQVSMMGMQKMAPQMELLKKKFANDPTALQQAQTELYKSVGFTPVLGCLPMFLQMPIFIALWRSLQTTFELRQAPFLYFFGIHFTWIHDLSMPDALVKFSSPFIVPYFLWHINGLNLLPLLMAVVTFINMKYFTPQPAATTPEQQQQQKMMLWMTLVFPLMLYSTPSGLILYYLTSTSLGIFESKRIRAHIKEREAEAAAKGTVIVDAGKLSRVTRRRQEVVPAAGAPKGWLARLQEKAEEMAREAQKQQKKKKKL